MVAAISYHEAQPETAKLVLLSGDDAGRTFVVMETCVLGRDPDADVQVVHSTVSRRHARVWRADDGRYFVEDLGSANGTAVGSRCISEPTELRPNDRVQLGPKVQLRFEVVDGVP